MVGDGTRVPDTLTPVTRSYIVNVVTGDGGMQANTYTVRNLLLLTTSKEQND